MAPQCSARWSLSRRSYDLMSEDGGISPHHWERRESKPTSEGAVERGSATTIHVLRREPARSAHVTSRADDCWACSACSSVATDIEGEFNYSCHGGTMMLAAVVLSLSAMQGAGGSNHDDTIKRFYQAMGARSPTIATFKHLFGGDSEAELDTLLAIYAPNVYTDGGMATDQRVLNITRERLSTPAGPSEFLGCLRRLHPQLFSSKSLLRINSGNVSNPSEHFDHVVAATRGGNVTFVFERHASTIEDIILPNDQSVFLIIPQCGNRARGSPTSATGEAGKTERERDAGVEGR